MSRILVAYASPHGQTGAIAAALAARLRAAGHLVDLADAEASRPPPPEDYDAVILGSHIRVGKHAASIARYVREFRDDLAACPTAFYSVSMSAAQAGAGADPHEYLAKFFREVGWRPVRSIALGGALHYRRYGWFLRFFMKQLARAGGHSTDTSRDHVYTDWKAVEHFADAIVGDLVPVSPRRPADPPHLVN